MFAIALFLIAYERSRFTPVPDDAIIADHIDTFEVLQTNIKRPTNIKSIEEFSLTTEKATLEMYPWPNHPGDLPVEFFDEERKSITGLYCNKVDLTQDQLFRHPVAPMQDGTTYEVLDKEPAVKVKITLNPLYGNTRMTNLYLPPGELITFELISDDAVGKVSVRINPEKKEEGRAFALRYPFTIGYTTLTKKVSTWGYPFGGVVTLSYNGQRLNRPLELIVTGCLKAPLYQYGITDEAEFVKEVESSKVPMTMFDNGLIVQITRTSSYIGHINRVDDASYYWRSSFMRSQKTAPDLYNSHYGRPWQPNRWYCDTFVPYGEACAYTTSNFNQYPFYWTPGICTYTSIVNDGSWGTHHEFNHHHQYYWGWNETGEVTNNVVSGVTYSLQTRVASVRTVNDAGNFVCPRDHNGKFVGFCLLRNRAPETQFQLLIQYFGPKNFQKYTKMCTENKEFPDTVYSSYGKHVLCATKVFKTGLLDFFKLFNDRVDTLLDDKKDAFYAEYDRSPYRHVQFHPVFCFFCLGYVRNGAKFTTTSDYMVNPKSITRFDFIKSMAQINDDPSLFGDFEFSAFHGSDKWTEVSKGIYDYKPNGNILEIEEFTVDYIDKTRNNAVTTCYGQLRLKLTEDKFLCERYLTTEYFKNVTEAYLSIQGIEPNETLQVTGIISPTIKKRFITVTYGFFIPTETGEYNFSCRADELGAIYLSTKPLSGDPEKDKQYLIFQRNYYTYNPNNEPKSEPQSLREGTKYYLNFVIYNANGEGGGNLLISKKTDTTLSNFPTNWYRYETYDQNTLNKYEYRPEIINIPEIDKWQGEKDISVDPADWKLIEATVGKKRINTNNNEGSECPDCDINKILFDYDTTTEYRVNWWPQQSYTKFPHTFVINFTKMTKFSYVKITGTANPSWFKMNSSIEIRTAEKYEDLSDNETTVFFGRYVSTEDKYLRIGSNVEGMFLMIIVHDNTFNWKDGHPGRTSFSEIEVGTQLVYATHVTVPKGCTWTKQKGGYRTNGRAFIGKAGDQYSFTVPNGAYQFGFIGDRYPGMGTATVYKNNVAVGKIEDKLSLKDQINLKYASKSYMQILYMSDNFTGTPTFKIVVDKGEIAMSALLVGRPDDPPEEDSDYPDEEPVPDAGKETKKSGLGKTGTIGIAVAVVVVVIALAVAGLILYLRHKWQKELSDSSDGKFII